MTNEVTTRADAPVDVGGKVDAARGVAERTAGRAGEVVGEARAQAETVARDVRVQARDLLQRGRHDLDVEATVRSRQAAGSVRMLADRMGALASGDPAGAGPLADLLQEGEQRLQRFAGRLEDGPSAVLEDLRGFARRQPVLFLAAAGGLGFLTGRLVRAGRAASSSRFGGVERAERSARAGRCGAGWWRVDSPVVDRHGAARGHVEPGCGPVSERVFERANHQTRSSAHWCTAEFSKMPHLDRVHQ